MLAEKLPKGSTISVGVGALVVRIGNYDVAVQVLDTPGDERFAPLGRIFYPTVPYCLLMYDVTSYESFEALQPLLHDFLSAHPGIDPAAHCCLVANEARVGMKHAVSPGYALEWCEAHGDIPFFEVDPEAPQGILEALRQLVDEFVTEHPITTQPVVTNGRATVKGAGGTGSFFDVVRAAKEQQKASALKGGLASMQRTAEGGQQGGATAGGGAAKPARSASGKRAVFTGDVLSRA